MTKVKRVYDKVEKADGKRLLVDRLWPRGLRKEKASIDEWLKMISPSDKLRRWYGHKPGRWTEFKLRYRMELSTPPLQQVVEKLRWEGKRETITLLYASRDPEHNNAVVLKELLERG